MEHGEVNSDEEIIRFEVFNQYMPDAEVRLDQTGVLDQLNFSPWQEFLLKFYFARQVVEQQRGLMGDEKANQALKVFDKEVEGVLKKLKGNEHKTAKEILGADIFIQSHKTLIEEGGKQSNATEDMIKTEEQKLMGKWARPVGSLEGIAELGQKLSNIFFPNSSKSEREMAEMFKPVVDEFTQKYKGTVLPNNTVPFPAPPTDTQQAA